jgi:hypothetical protein
MDLVRVVDTSDSLESAEGDVELKIEAVFCLVWT